MIQLQQGEAYLLYGKPHAGKSTLGFQLLSEVAKDKSVVLIPTEIWKRTYDKWNTIFNPESTNPRKLLIQDVAGWAPEETLKKLFTLFGDEVRLGLVPAKNKTGEKIQLRSFNIESYGNKSVIKDLLDAGERFFIFDSMSAPIKAVFELSSDLRGNLGPRDTCFSRLLWYVSRMCMNYGATTVVIDHETKDPANKYDKPEPYGPSSLRFLAKYWMLLTQSEGKEITDIHQLTVTRNIKAREYTESYMLRLGDKGFTELSQEEIIALAKKKGEQK